MSLLPTAISRPLVDIARFIDPHERAGGLAHHDAVDPRELLEMGVAVSGEYGAAGGHGSSGDDQVVRPTFRPAAVHVGE